MTDTPLLPFPSNFLWGTASSAYQIEGSPTADGKGPSIWDTFSHTPGKIERQETGDRAAEHYLRYQDDIRLMKEMGLNAYRFSIAWSRIFPQGNGSLNPAGLDFYDRLIDELLANGLAPVLTLFHWDLPQALQDQGGWPNRQTTDAFADYAAVIARRLGDRVAYWITHNEPWVAAMAGHFTGEHAPGIQDPFAALQSVHHLLLSHGKALQALRSELPAGKPIGITLNLSPVHPASNTPEDQAAAHLFDAVLNRSFLDPLLYGHYPQELLEALGPFFPPIEPDDLRLISAPLDFLGVNYYTRAVIRHDPQTPLIHASQVQPIGNEYSQMWEIYPVGLFELLLRLQRDYPPLPLFITENGVPVPDGVDADGRVRDERRIRYLHQHLVQLQRAIQQGVPVIGYLVWSLLDNFEWAYGYRMRFGLCYVDFETQQRILKDSGRWFAEIVRHNGVPPLPGAQGT